MSWVIFLGLLRYCTSVFTESKSNLLHPGIEITIIIRLRTNDFIHREMLNIEPRDLNPVFLLPVRYSLFLCL